MTKDQLLEHIDEGIRTEESAITLYLRHLDAVVTRCGRPNEEVARMKGIIDSLVGNNRRHKALLENLRQEIKAEAVNVY